MKPLFGMLIFLSGCTALPQLGQDITTISTDNAIKISIQKEALQKETDVRIQIDVKNKDL